MERGVCRGATLDLAAKKINGEHQACIKPNAKARFLQAVHLGMGQIPIVQKTLRGRLYDLRAIHEAHSRGKSTGEERESALDTLEREIYKMHGDWNASFPQSINRKLGVECFQRSNFDFRGCSLEQFLQEESHDFSHYSSRHLKVFLRAENNRRIPQKRLVVHAFQKEPIGQRLFEIFKQLAGKPAITAQEMYHHLTSFSGGELVENFPKQEIERLSFELANKFLGPQQAPTEVVERVQLSIKMKIENLFKIILEPHIAAGRVGQHVIYCDVAGPYELQDVNIPNFQLFKTENKAEFKLYLALWATLMPYNFVTDLTEIRSRQGS